MASPLWAVLHGSAPLSGVRFGIEVEVEGMYDMHSRLEGDGPFNSGKYWRCIKDGSLRNSGVELVTRGGIKESDVPAALTALGELFSDTSADNKPSFSVRTSTHVHVNVQDLSCVQVLAFVVVAAAVEPLLQLCVQPERRTNLFCIPMHMCSTFRSCLRSCYVGIQNSPRSSMEHLTAIGKYSSVNTGRLYDLGTLEFRSMHGAEDIQHVLKWCTVLSRVRDLVSDVVVLHDVVPILLRSEEDMREYLFGGLDLNFKSGTPAMTYKEAVACSLSVLSYMKSAPRNIGSLLYTQARPGITLEAAATDHELMWDSTSRAALRAYSTPPQNIVASLSEDVTARGQVRYDCYVSDSGAVLFYVLEADNVPRYICKYVQPEQADALPECELTFKRK